jgi:hypothetical protein
MTDLKSAFRQLLKEPWLYRRGGDGGFATRNEPWTRSPRRQPRSGEHTCELLAESLRLCAKVGRFCFFQRFELQDIIQVLASFR